MTCVFLSAPCLNPAAQPYWWYQLSMMLQRGARWEHRQIMCGATGINYKGLQVGRVYIRKVVVCTDLQYEQIHFSVMKLLFWNVYLPFYVYAELYERQHYGAELIFFNRILSLLFPGNNYHLALKCHFFNCSRHIHFQVSKTKSLVSLASGFNGKTTPLSR